MEKEIDLTQFELSIKFGWEKLRLLGRGSSSVVYLARCNFEESLFAVKEIQTDNLDQIHIQIIEQEITFMKSMSHINVIKFFGSQRRDGNLHIFMEFASHGSLRQFIQTKGPLNEQKAKKITSQVVCGLQYLHGNNIAHRDVKGANILLCKSGIVKLGDFGSSKHLESDSIISGLKGTPHWMAPEVIRGTATADGWIKADVWSLGCTVVEMLTGRMPFSKYPNQMTAMYRIASGEVPTFDDVKVSLSAVEFVCSCCNPEPDKRPSISMLKSCQFIHLGVVPSHDMTFETNKEVQEEEYADDWEVTGNIELQDKPLMTVDTLNECYDMLSMNIKTPPLHSTHERPSYAMSTIYDEDSSSPELNYTNDTIQEDISIDSPRPPPAPPIDEDHHHKPNRNSSRPEGRQGIRKRDNDIDSSYMDRPHAPITGEVPRKIVLASIVPSQVKRSEEMNRTLSFSSSTPLINPQHAVGKDGARVEVASNVQFSTPPLESMMPIHGPIISSLGPVVNNQLSSLFVNSKPYAEPKLMLISKSVDCDKKSKLRARSASNVVVPIDSRQRLPQLIISSTDSEACHATNDDDDDDNKNEKKSARQSMDDIQKSAISQQVECSMQFINRIQTRRPRRSRIPPMQSPNIFLLNRHVASAPSALPRTVNLPPIRRDHVKDQMK